MNVTFKPPEMYVEIAPAAISTTTGTPVARDYVGSDPYTGSYTVEPSTEEQILPTKNLRMTDDVVIGAIPSDYGKISWNGSTLTVS